MNKFYPGDVVHYRYALLSKVTLESSAEVGGK